MSLCCFSNFTRLLLVSISIIFRTCFSLFWHLACYFSQFLSCFSYFFQFVFPSLSGIFCVMNVASRTYVRCLKSISQWHFSLTSFRYLFHITLLFLTRIPLVSCILHAFNCFSHFFEIFSHISQFQLMFLLVSSCSSFTCFSHLYQSLIDHLSVAFNFIICFLYFFYLLITCLYLLLACLQSFLPSLSVDSSITFSWFFYHLYHLLLSSRFFVKIPFYSSSFSDSSNSSLRWYNILFRRFSYLSGLHFASFSVAFQISVSCF
jgi:hypothetical protein